MLMLEMMAAGHVPAKGEIDGRAHFTEQAATEAHAAPERAATPANRRGGTGANPSQAGMAYRR